MIGSKKQPGIPCGLAGLTLLTDYPLDADSLWARRRGFMFRKVSDGVREISADGVVSQRETDCRIERLFEENPAPPSVSASPRHRRHEHLLIAVPRPAHDHDRDFNGMEGIFALKWTLSAKCRKKFKGAAPRVVVVPHDEGDGIVHARIGSNLYLPEADEPEEGVLTATWTDAAGDVRPINIPSWPCLRLIDGRVDPCDKPVGVYAAQRRLILGLRKTTGGGVGLVVPGDVEDAEGRIVVDLYRVRAAWREGQAHEFHHSMADGALTLRLTPAPGARTEEPKPQARPASSAGRDPRFPPVPAFLRGGASSSETPSRAEPYLRPASAKAAGMEKPTLVPPIPVQDANGEKPTLVLPNTVRAKRSKGVLAVTAFALPRVDGACANTAASGWTIRLGRDGLPVCEERGDSVAVTLHANEQWPHVLFKRPEDGKWRAFTGAAAQDVLPSGCRLRPAPAPLGDRYHALLSVPVRQPINLKEGRHRFGRAASAGDDRKLSFDLLALPGTLALRGEGGASLDAFNLSREHGALSLEQGQLHVALTTGRTPIWKLTVDGAVAGRAAPEDRGELILTAEESFVVGAYVVTFLGEG